MKIGAVAILTTMTLGLFGWGGAQIIENTQQLARLEERNRTVKEHVVEIKQDVKEIKRHLINGL